MEQYIFTLVLLTCSCLAAPTNGPGGKESPDGAQSEIALENEGAGETLRTNEILPPPVQQEHPSYLIHGEGLFQPPSAGTLKLYMPVMQKVMAPPLTIADFDFLDQNGNSLIETTELAIGSNLPGFADHAFRISDLDNDGFVNLDEFFQFPMTWQRVVAEVRFQDAAHAGMGSNTESDGNGETTTPYDSQGEGNSTIVGVTGSEDQVSATEAVSDITAVGGETEGEAENEGQLVGTTGLTRQVTDTGRMPVENEREASSPARTNGMTSGQTSDIPVDGPESQTDGYQSPSAPDVGPSNGDRGKEQDQDQVGTNENGVRPSDTQGYYERPHKPSYDPTYPVKSMSGYIDTPYMKVARPNVKGYIYPIQRSRTGDSSEEERGGGSSSDEDEDDRK